MTQTNTETEKGFKMPVPYSVDLRWRILWLHLYDELSYKSIACRLSVSLSTVCRIVKLYNRTDHVLPQPQQCEPCRLLGSREEDILMECLSEDPGIYLNELQYKLYQRAAVLVSLPTICNTIRRLGYTRKRIRHVVQAQDVMRRAEFMAEMSYLQADMLIWIDETGSDHRVSSRCFGYHLRGLTRTDTVLSIRGERLSAVVAMSTRGIEDIDICEGTTNGEKFASFLERCIVPILQPFNGSNPRSVVVLDNASIHHVERI